MRFLELIQGAAVACAALGSLGFVGKTRAMYRSWRPPEIGEHDLIRIPMAEAVFADLRNRTAGQKATVSQLSADLLAIITGHPEMVCELNPAALSLSSLLAHATDMRIAHPDIGTRIRIEVRLPRPVYDEIRGWAVERPAEADQIAADLLAIATGHPEGVRRLDRVDLLRLASATPIDTAGGVTAGTHKPCTA